MNQARCTLLSHLPVPRAKPCLIVLERNANYDACSIRTPHVTCPRAGPPRPLGWGGSIAVFIDPCPACHLPGPARFHPPSQPHTPKVSPPANPWADTATNTFFAPVHCDLGPSWRLVLGVGRLRRCIGQTEGRQKENYRGREGQTHIFSRRTRTRATALRRLFHARQRRLEDASSSARIAAQAFFDTLATTAG